MSTPGLETYFEPEKRLAYTPERMAKLIRAVEKSDPPFRTIYSWSWRLRNLETGLEFAGSLSGFPSAGLTVHSFDARYQLPGESDWRHYLYDFVQTQRPPTPKCVLSLLIKREGRPIDPEAEAPIRRLHEFWLRALRFENDIRDWELRLEFRPWSEAPQRLWAILPAINPRWTRRESEPSIEEPYMEVGGPICTQTKQLFYDGDQQVGASRPGKVEIKRLNNSPEALVEIADRWEVAARIPRTTPIGFHCKIYSEDKEGDITAEALQMLARTGTLPATQTDVLTEYAVLSPEGLETLRQWPLTTNGKEFESGICYFERTQRQRGAISVATGANGQYIFFSAPGLKMKEEMEKLFGLKLKRVKRDD